MEKKIVFTPVEPNKNLLWLHYKNGLLVLQRFGSNGWEDITNSDQITEAEVMELIKDKANLVGGKVPAEELPSYVDDVIEFVRLMVPTTQISMILTTYHDNYKNKICFIDGQTSLSGAVGDKDNYPNMFINFGENNSEDDWTVFEPEEGKIYISTDNNHSYRWSGSQLIDLDQSWSNDIKDLKANVVRTDKQTLSADKQKQVFENLGWKVYVTLSTTVVNKIILSTEILNNLKACRALLFTDTGTMLLKGISTNNDLTFASPVNEKQIYVFKVSVIDQRSGKLELVDISDTKAILFGDTQNLNMPQQNIALTNIGLKFVVIPRSYLGKILSDDYVTNIIKSKGLIIATINETEIKKTSIFIKTESTDDYLYFIAISDTNTIEKIEYNISTKQISTISKLDIVPDAVKVTSQNLTDIQKQQARTNIGVKSADELLEDADFIAQLKTKLETV